MFRLFILTISILYSCFALAKSSYQVDLIIFTHAQSADKNSTPFFNSPLVPISKDAITLQSDTNKSFNSYHLLAASQSGLSNEYYLLSRKSHFQVLGHYSWRQPNNSQSTVALPNASSKGWEMQGTVRVQQSNYYLFNANIQFSPPSNPEGSFTVSQKQRLIDNTVYFLDHPQVGMLVKVHKLS